MKGVYTFTKCVNKIFNSFVRQPRRVLSLKHECFRCSLVAARRATHHRAEPVWAGWRTTKWQTATNGRPKLCCKRILRRLASPEGRGGIQADDLDNDEPPMPTCSRRRQRSCSVAAIIVPDKNKATSSIGGTIKISLSVLVAYRESWTHTRVWAR